MIYELREPTEKDWKGGIKTYHLKIQAYIPHFADIKLDQDEDWNIRELKRLNLPLSNAPTIEVHDDLIFYDETGSEITSAMLLFNSLTPKGYSEMPPKKITHPFNNPTFIKTRNPLVMAKIKSINVTISKTLEIIEEEFKGEDMVGHILKNVIEGSVKTFPKVKS